MDIQAIVKGQQAYFSSGATWPLKGRKEALQALKAAIQTMETEIKAALHQDLGKASFESYISEIGITLEEISFVVRHFEKWAKPQKVPTPLIHFPSRSRIHREPYGVVLVMAPWNYPFQLSLVPLVGALAAGNCVVVKPSAYAPATSTVVKKLLETCFSPEYVAVVEGGREQNTQLLQQRFDTIFFTGSTEVGKMVMEQAAKTLTPVSLELGGKSPCIVDESADIELAGRRIAFGKFLNAGQTCVAPDYVLVQESVKDALVASLSKAVEVFFGKDPLQNPELPKIINQKHFSRLKNLMQNTNILFGGRDDGASRIEPTVLDNAAPDSPIMHEEIFGPLLPVLTYQTLPQAISFINNREKPLALYFFSSNTTAQQTVLQACSFGGGCINDTLTHLATPHLPFGGVGYSGMGAYHGRRSFDTFTHQKSVVSKGRWPDLAVRYHPYSDTKEKLVRKFWK